MQTSRREALVALVEDDHALADNLSETLSDAGFTTLTAGSVSEAGQLRALSPFCAVVDLRVPGGADGEAMRVFAARFPGVPIVCSTGLAQVAPPVACAAVLHKPYSLHVLLTHVTQLHNPTP